MKPMVYCTGRGAACLPTEITSLARSLLRLNPRLGEKNLIHMISRFLEWPLRHEDLNEMETRELPEELVCFETQRAKEAAERKVPVFTGIEAVASDIRSASSERVASYLKNAMEGGADGIILSWDIALVPDENLKAIHRFLTGS